MQGTPARQRVTGRIKRPSARGTWRPWATRRISRVAPQPCARACACTSSHAELFEAAKKVFAPTLRCISSQVAPSSPLGRSSGRSASMQASTSRSRHHLSGAPSSGRPSAARTAAASAGSCGLDASAGAQGAGRVIVGCEEKAPARQRHSWRRSGPATRHAATVDGCAADWLRGRLAWCEIGVRTFLVCAGSEFRDDGSQRAAGAI
jgi:hypothetical protein